MLRIVKPDATELADTAEDITNLPVHVEDETAAATGQPVTVLESTDENVTSLPDSTDGGLNVESDGDAKNARLVIGIDDPADHTPKVDRRKSWKLCPICGKLYRALHIHMQLHRRKDIQCPDCGRKFARNDYLVEHRHIHTGERPYLCVVCGRGFGSAANMRAHLRSHTDERRYQCDECGKWFRRSGGRTEHIRNVHEKVRAYQCQRCPRAFATSGGLKLHMMGHTNERPHACPLCPKRFKSLQTLNLHTSTHTGARLYPCAICGSRFTQRSAAKVHEATQHSADGGRCHECELCGQRFSKRSIRDAHVRRHRGEKPHSCSMCNWSFAFVGDLRNHMIKKHKMKSSRSAGRPQQTLARDNVKPSAQLT